MAGKHLVVERTYKASIEKVWEAITNKDQMKKWYFDVSDFKTEPGFEFQFYGESKDKKYLHRCTIVEVEPFKKISYTWSYDGYAGQSLVTFELFSESKSHTRVKLTHADLDQFPADNPDFAPQNFNDGWNAIVGESLRNFVETGTITKSVNIHASLDVVWNIVLNPNNQWALAFGNGAVADTDWKESSPITWRDAENNVGATGIIEQHHPGQSLVMHYYDATEPGPGDMLGEYYEKITLKRGDDQSVLSIEVGELPKYYIPSHQEMWEKALERIKMLAEE